MRISDWSSDVCSSDLRTNSCTHPFVLCDLAMEYEPETLHPVSLPSRTTRQQSPIAVGVCLRKIIRRRGAKSFCVTIHLRHRIGAFCNHKFLRTSFTTSLAAMASFRTRSEEHTSELQSLMRNSYAVFCVKKKNNIKYNTTTKQN